MSTTELVAFLEDEAAERIFATGGQVYVSVDSVPVIDVAVGVDGVDRLVDVDTLFAVYCAGKPAFALTLAALVEEGEVSFDDRLGDVVDRPLPPTLAPLELRHLVAHTAGLHMLDAHTYLAATPSVRDELALANEPPLGWRQGVDVAYSQIGAWHLLAWAVEDLAGESVRAAVRRRALVPAGVGDDLFVGGMTDDEYTAHRGRLGVNAYLRGPVVDPILTERTRRFRCLDSPAFGSTASARGLGKLYEALVEMGDREVVRELVATHARGEDPVMGRTCAYGFGFMTELRDHDFGSLVGPRAFGHSGYGGMTAAFADPDHGLVVAFHFNGRIDADSALSYRRPALVDRIYRAALKVDDDA